MQTTEKLQQEIYSFDSDVVISDLELIMGALENYCSECEDQRINNIMSRFSIVLSWLHNHHKEPSSEEDETIRDRFTDFSIQMDTQLQSLCLILSRLAEVSGQGVTLPDGLNSVDILWGITSTIKTMIAECKTQQTY